MMKTAIALTTLTAMVGGQLISPTVTLEEGCDVVGCAAGFSCEADGRCVPADCRITDECPQGYDCDPTSGNCLRLTENCHTTGCHYSYLCASNGTCIADCLVHGCEVGFCQGNGYCDPTVTCDVPGCPSNAVCLPSGDCKRITSPTPDPDDLITPRPTTPDFTPEPDDLIKTPQPTPLPMTIDPLSECFTGCPPGTVCKLGICQKVTTESCRITGCPVGHVCVVEGDNKGKCTPWPFEPPMPTDKPTPQPPQPTLTMTLIPQPTPLPMTIDPLSECFTGCPPGTVCKLGICQKVTTESCRITGCPVGHVCVLEGDNKGKCIVEVSPPPQSCQFVGCPGAQLCVRVDARWVCADGVTDGELNKFHHSDDDYKSLKLIIIIAAVSLFLCNVLIGVLVCKYKKTPPTAEPIVIATLPESELTKPKEVMTAEF